ncbi:MAG: prolyl oligopeptidase family serine peptidase [Spirosomataceae bacterium]
MKKYYLIALGLLVGLPLLAQKKKAVTPVPPPIVKKPLSHEVYDTWKNISERAISRDGEWVGYGINPAEGDGTLVLSALKKAKIDSIQRGSELRLTFDSEQAVFRIKAPFKATRDARRAKKKKEEMPKDSLGIYSLKTNSLTKIPNILSFKVPEKAGGWLAYLLDVPPPVKPDLKDTNKKAAPPRPTRGKQPKKESEENGYKLVIRNLKSNAEQTYGFVKEYEFAKTGRYLAFSSTGNDSSMKAGVYVWDAEKGSILPIYEGRSKQKFTKFSFAENGDQLAFIADLDTNAKSQIRVPKLFYWKSGQEKANLLADENNQPGPKGWLVSADYTPNFAKDGSKLFFGTNPKPIVQDTTLLADEIVNVEVWNYQDERLQTQQKTTLEQDKKKSYLAVANLDSKKLVQLGSKKIPDIQIVNEGRANYVIGRSDVLYSHQHWDWNPKEDVYLIDTQDGTSTQIGKHLRGNPQISPEGKYIVWFSLPDTAWFCYSIANKKTIQLTKDKKFADEDDDHPDYPNSYGSAGWTKGDERFWIYDKYDIWSINPETGAAENLTKTGRQEKKEYRYVRLDNEMRYIDPTKVLLHSSDYTTKGSGYYSLANGTLAKLMEGDFNVSQQVLKAKNTEDILFTKTTFRDYPDLLQSDLTFKTVKKVSDVGSQMNQYLWGSVELVKYQSGDGTPLEGLLYKPENFDPTKKYPMLVYFYEKNADNLHNFVTPSPSGSAYTNYAMAASNGYLVFVPDIIYKIGYPGQSAYECIIPGVLSQINKGFVDKANIGIVGHSWGGYQTAYLITKTNLFKAAVPGAPVANMTSAYGGIRWGTGMSRQAQYEATQSRIGGTLWQKPEQYLDNSPLFYLDQVKTPALILHNDDDDAVPWYQGIELFMGLKRLDKPVWMLNYNGEKHGNRQRKNQKDFSVRMWQFLDHYLKGAPMPSWMSEGLPMIEKGINQHLETSTSPTKVQSGNEK